MLVTLLMADYQSTITANFKLFHEENKTDIVEVSNVFSANLNDNSPAQSLCVNNKNFLCNYDLTKPFNFTSQGLFFDIDVAFDNIGTSLWDGFVDDGTLDSFDGSLSRWSILNVDDNYSIFATSVVNYTLEDNQVYANVISMALQILRAITALIIMEYQLCNNSGSTFSLDVPLPLGDSKFIVFASIDIQNFDIGRFIIRDGQTLMKEGVAYTPQNNCIFFNQPYSQNQVSHSEFCCQTFESK
uniref:Uncharacterized protein n=1 Tax=Panagrolaimus davidi TaxID=227884 RepID=A0A914QCQ7_9BILA